MPIEVMYCASLISKSSRAPQQAKLHIMISLMCCRSFRATTHQSFLKVLESQIPQATWASWDNIVVRTEGGMGTVQIITFIVMLSLLLVVSTWGNGGEQESWPSVLLYQILGVCSPLLSSIVSLSSVNTASKSVSSYQLKT
jgi:hypothetical protein